MVWPGSSTVEAGGRAQVHPGGRVDLERAAVRGLHSARTAILRILASTDRGRALLTGDVIGRESELAILDRFLDSIPTGPSALLLSGEAGIGKTTVWKEGLASALQRRLPHALVRPGRGGDASFLRRPR